MAYTALSLAFGKCLFSFASDIGPCKSHDSLRLSCVPGDPSFLPPVEATRHYLKRSPDDMSRLNRLFLVRTLHPNIRHISRQLQIRRESRAYEVGLSEFLTPIRFVFSTLELSSL
jgi:hypothetical protein